MNMPDPTVPISMRLSPADFRALAEKAHMAGISRSEWLRRVIAGALSTTRETERAA